MDLARIIEHYGLFALFLGAGIEGETVVILGGIMVHRDILAFVPVMLCAAAGSFVADQLFFMLGRRFRHHPFVTRIKTRPAFGRALAIFERHPVLFIFGFRFAYGFRTVSPVAVGTTDLAATRFLAINLVAALVWGAAFVSVGYLFGEAIEAAFGRIRSVEHVVLAVLAACAAAGGLVFLVRRRRARS
ncbi:DedA family protein [Fulvimarina sp. 2208YS6-2-32]|uniref:DedA family protein n=1 Tax=Fulvimarina uroteuthidis TaxID=3098149 RepID=A0ABU5HXV6_9HYPH|nr:DedA family protein [Fulvimarina sp. 2208YS6-2-32]MDY8107885.1 DedA family protein [Fulvimarina sp. 2208YS6-2-32]